MPQILSQPGLGPDPDRALVEHRVLNLILDMAVCGGKVYQQRIWELIQDVQVRGIADLHTGFIGSAQPVCELNTIELAPTNGWLPNGKTLPLSQTQTTGSQRSTETRLITWNEAAKTVDPKQRAFARFVSHAVRRKAHTHKPDCFFDLTKADSGQDFIRQMEEWEKAAERKRKRTESPPVQRGSTSGEGGQANGQSSEPNRGGQSQSGQGGITNGDSPSTGATNGAGKGRELRKRRPSKTRYTEKDVGDGNDDADTGEGRRRRQRRSVHEPALDSIAPKTAPAVFGGKWDERLATPVSVNVK